MTMLDLISRVELLLAMALPAGLIALAAPTFAQEPAPTYTNPVGGEIRMGDPFVVRYGETYYLTGTTDSGRGFRMWTSRNLVDWTPVGFVYEKTDQTWGTGSFWAPELFQYRGRYYLIYSASRKGDDGEGPGFRVCLAVADEPTGPYRDLHAPFADPGDPCIDGHVFVDEDGTPYLYYAKVGVRREPTFKLLASNYGVALKPDLSGPAGEPVLCTEADQPWEMPEAGRSLCTEGAFVFKAGDVYYMTYSANHYAEPFYGIGYATAPAPLGPWTKAPDNPLVETDLAKGVSGPGHCSFTTSPDGTERFMVYHAHANPKSPSGGRTVNIDRLTIPEPGRLKLQGPTRTPQPLPSGAEPASE